MVALKCVDNSDEHDVIVVTDSGVVMKMPIDQISVLKRATQGVRLINLKGEQSVSTVAIVDKEENVDFDDSDE